MTLGAAISPLIARGVTKRFRGATGLDVPALRDISLEARAGALTALVGPDSAGKTTLIRLAAGLIAPDSGELSVLGFDVARQPQAVQDRVGYMPQRFGLYEDLSVQENLDLYADLHGVGPRERRARYAELMDMTALGPFRDRLAGHTNPEEKLRIVIDLVVDKLTSPMSSAWAFTVLGREVVAPSAAMETLRETQAAPKARIVRSIVGQLMGLDADHPAVARACLNIVAPLLMLAVTDRRTLLRVLPALGLSRADAPTLARHMFTYAMAGIAAVAGSESNAM